MTKSYVCPILSGVIAGLDGSAKLIKIDCLKYECAAFEKIDSDSSSAGYCTLLEAFVEPEKDMM